MTRWSPANVVQEDNNQAVDFKHKQIMTNEGKQGGSHHHYPCNFLPICVGVYLRLCSNPEFVDAFMEEKANMMKKDKVIIK